MNDLEQEILRLKRELAEAREQMDAFINQWSETNNSLQRELLALSASHQRQNDALTYALRAGDPEEAWEPIAKAIQDALAETPDVSMWEKWLQALDVIEDLHKFYSTVKSRAFVATLQPDHQK